MYSVNRSSAFSGISRFLALGVLILVTTLTGCATDTVVEPSNQSDYPVLPDIGWVDSIPTPLSDQVAEATLIVDATVTQVKSNKTEILHLDPNSPEGIIAEMSGQGLEQSLTFGFVDFEVSKVLKGTARTNLTMKISPVALGAVPDFQPGDRFILLLRENPDGDLFSVRLQEAYWYVAKDSKVYPSVLTDELKQYSGTDLSSFKSDIETMQR